MLAALKQRKLSRDKQLAGGQLWAGDGQHAVMVAVVNQARHHAVGRHRRHEMKIPPWMRGGPLDDRGGRT